MNEQPSKSKPTQIPLKEYLAAKAKEEKKKKQSKIPLPVMIFLLTPLLIVFCFGLFYLPFLLFQIATGKSASDQNSKSTVSRSETKR